MQEGVGDKKEEARPRGVPAPWEPERWIRDEDATRGESRGARSDRGGREASRPSGRQGPAGPARSGAPRAVRARPSGGGHPSPGGTSEVAETQRSGPRSRRVSEDLTRDVVRAAGTVDGARLAQRLVDASRCLERGRVVEAVRMLRPLVRRLPDVAGVREQAGLAFYRSRRWDEAARHLEAYVRLSGSVDQHPVLADCWRALGRFDKVDALWEELRQASPAPALLVEGRIVVAGARADRGDLAGAIRLLERSPAPRKGGTREHHLRLWYALGDLYERVGDLPRARELFGRVVAADRGLADAAERLDALGPPVRESPQPPRGRT